MTKRTDPMITNNGTLVQHVKSPAQLGVIERHAHAAQVWVRWDDGILGLELITDLEPPECLGHPAGTVGVMGQTAYCDGSCRRAGRPCVA